MPGNAFKERAARGATWRVRPLGAKGAGGGGIHAPPGAVLCAVNDALRPLGVLATEVPAGPSRIWQLIQDAKRTS